MRYGIVVIGYNRAGTMKRLLDRLNCADYKGDKPVLIISIDKSDCAEVYQTAKSFDWKHGKCICRFQEQMLGLRKHILKCGEYLEEYDLDAIAVFEDDIYPSLAFYNYMKQAVEYYKDNEQIAGISLYTHLWNVEAQLPFQPDYNGYDTFFMQYAQSWGQVWLREQWKQFINWYTINEGKINDIQELPDSIRRWPETSWLKYHIAYCVLENKYFVYPYESLSTCFNEVGTHTTERMDIFQVPLMQNCDKIYEFSPLEKATVSYDVYFEREQIGEWVGIPFNELTVDLWGKKSRTTICSKQYLLTSRRYPWQVVDSFGLVMRPHEINVKEAIRGNDFILYNTQIAETQKIENSKVDIIKYYFRLFRGILWYIKHLWWLTIRKIF